MIEMEIARAKFNFRSTICCKIIHVGIKCIKNTQKLLLLNNVKVLGARSKIESPYFLKMQNVGMLQAKINIDEYQPIPSPFILFKFLRYPWVYRDKASIIIMERNKIMPFNFNVIL